MKRHSLRSSLAFIIYLPILFSVTNRTPLLPVTEPFKRQLLGRRPCACGGSLRVPVPRRTEHAPKAGQFVPLDEHSEHGAGVYRPDGRWSPGGQIMICRRATPRRRACRGATGSTCRWSRRHRLSSAVINVA